MRPVLLVSLGLLVASGSAAQTRGLPQFSDYPAGPAYRGRVAPLVEASSPNARLFRTRTRQAMAEGVNFAGHLIVATWGCGTECMSGQIVDARTGRAVADLPVSSPYTEFRAGSRLITVNTPADIIESRGWDAEEPIPSYYQSSYWVWEDGGLRHLGSLLASDIDQIRRGGPVPPLRTATPGDVLVPLAVGNTWIYAGTSSAGPFTVTYRVTGSDPEPYSNGFRVERTVQDGDGTRRTVETWSPGYGVGDGSLNVRTADDESRGYSYSFGVAEAGYGGSRVERSTVRVGAEAREAVCYVEGEGGDAPAPRRTCFVPRVGMVSDDGRDTMTLTAHTIR